MDDKKKKFVIPDAEVVDFAMEDIITWSNRGMLPDDWDDPDKDIF